ncbi:MAG: hypothetical protein K2N51_15055 [Lachnospiraceae bacterium]|nr:hypothetical protein [Lachnospiraceae bacterium]
MENVKRSRNEVPTIDVNLCTVETRDGIEFGFDTANQIEVEPQTEETDAVKLVVKGKLRAQKPKEVTITGHEITLHDNVFNPQLVRVLQGGKILYWQDEEHTKMDEEETPFGVAKYMPPIAGSDDKGEVFTFNAYSAIYNAAGIITGYEKTMYPNCQGTPVAFNSEDGAFRAPEYTISSAPDVGEAPYEMTWIDTLPQLVDPEKLPTIKIPSGDLLGKTATELGDYYIASGNILGTLNRVEEYFDFSSITEEQEGYYVALEVDKWQGNSFRLDRITGKGKPVSFNGDGIVIVWLGADEETAKTATRIVVIIDGTEIKYDIKVKFN